MNRHIRAALPTLLDLAYRSKYASESVDAAPTHFTKRAHLINLDGINNALVEESIKLGSAILKSIEATKQEDELSSANRQKKPKPHTKEGMSLGKGLLAGAAVSAVPAIAANYTLDRANETLHDNMMAIPGLAASTVGAILAARQLSNSGLITPIAKDHISELEGALEAKQVVDSALRGDQPSGVRRELQKMSSISTDHIASLIASILS